MEVNFERFERSEDTSGISFVGSFSFYVGSLGCTGHKIERRRLYGEQERDGH